MRERKPGAEVRRQEGAGGAASALDYAGEALMVPPLALRRAMTAPLWKRFSSGGLELRRLGILRLPGHGAGVQGIYRAHDTKLPRLHRLGEHRLGVA